MDNTHVALDVKGQKMSVLEQNMRKFWQQDRVCLNLATFEITLFTVKCCVCVSIKRAFGSERQKLSQTNTREHEKALTGEAPSFRCNSA